MLEMARVREVFEASTDFTVGLEEEFAILDPRTLSLDHRFEELRELAQDDPVLAESVAGELIRSEIEIRSGRGENFADAVARQRDARSRLFALAARNDALLGATGTHPGAPGRSSRSSTRTTIAACRICSSTWPGGTTRSACTYTSASEAPSARCGCATACAR